MYFFQKGKKYRVITARVGTRGAPHFFEIGAIVTCRSVEPVGARQSLTRGFLAGDFIDSEGFVQTLCTGDVVAL